MNGHIQPRSSLGSPPFPSPTHLLLATIISITAASRVSAAMHFVDLASTNATAPYSIWATAATNIQDAIDAADAGDEIVVTNGVYATGGRVVYGAMTNRVAVTKPVTVRSVNGPEATTVLGGQPAGSNAVRCVYLGDGASLLGFTLRGGATRYSTDDRERSGGGVWCASASALVSNCIFYANGTSYNGSGGAAYGGTLKDCVLSNNAATFGGGADGTMLDHCTLTNNSAVSGGAAYLGALKNCVVTGNSAYGSGGGAYDAALTNCTLKGNQTRASGGGAYGGILDNCVLMGNRTYGDDADDGGGAYQATLNKCTLTGNSSGYDGGGAAQCQLVNCTLNGNYASANGGGARDSGLTNCTLTGNSTWGFGGGAAGCTLNNCTLSGNRASGFPLGTYGGGAYGCTLNNCSLTGNSADQGGGASRGTLNNCSLTGNSAGVGGGVSDARVGGVTYPVTLNNCIVYYNFARLSAPDYSGGSFNYCCTTPLPTNGVGNISDEPQLASASHLSAGSPCRGAGSAAYSSGADIDGESWANPPAIGCDEYYSAGLTGLLTVAVEATYTNAAVGFVVDFRAQIDGRVGASRWEFGDGTVVSNRPYSPHSWAIAGDYPVVLRAYNQSYPDGVSATVIVHIVEQPVHYVALSSSSPVAPYLSWATAATNIQDAIDAAAVGGLVLVSDGVYQSGGRAIYGTLTNRVAVTKPLTVRSVNGPEMTLIQGYYLTNWTYYTVRCVYLTNGATLVGFTLTNGAARTDTNGEYHETTGGGVWCESASAVVSNCVLTGNSGGIEGGGSYSGTLNNCTLTGNSAFDYGGGAYNSTLNNCTLTANSAYNGGGASASVLNNCLLTGNTALDGGGASDCTLNGCKVNDNSAYETGGGVSDGSLNNCTLTGNSALYGGGAAGGTLRNCVLTSNSAGPCELGNLLGGFGGGAAGGTLNNCTLTGNSACSKGGGAFGSALNNCVLYYNTTVEGAGPNYDNSTLDHCCTTPLPTNGVGNISVDPQLASASHLSGGSPCRGAGRASFTTGVDIDGEPWSSPPSIGCDEYHPGAVTGLVMVALSASYTNVATGLMVDFRALIDGRGSASRWEFGDGTVVSNQPYASHSWAAAGDYPVVLRAYSESYPHGTIATLTMQVVEQPVHYVSLTSGNPLAPYLSWATAATSIQDAIDAAFAGGTVLVSKGVYQTGGRAVYGTMTNRVAVTKPLTVRSVNGQAVTVIQGYQVPGTTNGDGAVRCAYLTNGAVLEGFTLTNGATRVFYDEREGSGGGVWSESAGAVVSNCTISGNSADGSYSGGGGAFRGTLHNCTIARNSVSLESVGGGAYQSVLENCTVTHNSAGNAGGVYGGVLNNCTITTNAGGGAAGSTLNNCILLGNSSAGNGGGASGGTLTRCILSGNSASLGGGAEGGILNNCILTANSAQYGGGVYYGTLNNCTLISNSASHGGGASEAALNNCIIYYNTAADGTTFNYSYDLIQLNHCCTTPGNSGQGNVTAPPLFVDQASGNLRLQSNSPCVNAGLNTSASGVTDLDGRPRIIGVVVDIGAYEFQPGVSGVFIGWLQQYGLPTDGSADFTDPDGDHSTNFQEWRAGTDPTNALSALRLRPPLLVGPDLVVTWESVSGRSYSLDASTNLASSASFHLLATNIPGQPGTTTYTHTNAVGTEIYFYRVRVEE